MPKCSHQHNHQHADKWTNAAAGGQAIASFISDSYWLATLFDLVSNGKAKVIGLSYAGLIFGAIMAVLSAAGAAYAHRALNKNHQSTPQANIQQDKCKTTALAPQTLTSLQTLSLVGDFISHVGDLAGPIIFVINIATSNHLPRWGKVSAQLIAFIFASICSIANVRTCKNAMKNAQPCTNTTPIKQTQYKRKPSTEACASNHHNHQHADTWTNTAAGGEAITSFISDTYWLATLFDLVSNGKAKLIGLSYAGLIFGAIMAVLSAAGAAYAHRALNKNHQSPAQAKKIHQDKCKKVALTRQPLTSLQTLSLVGDFISHVGDLTGPIIFVINLATSNHLPRWGKVLAQLIAFIFGSICSIANVRTCKNAMKNAQLCTDTIAIEKDEQNHL